MIRKLYRESFPPFLQAKPKFTAAMLKSNSIVLSTQVKLLSKSS